MGTFPFVIMKIVSLILFLTGAVFADGFKVASWNVNYNNQQIRATLEMIMEVDPDIILFQESTRQLEEGVKAHLPVVYRHTWFTEPGKHPAGGFGVVSKHPLIKRRFIDNTRGLFGTQFLTVQMDGAELQLVNVHLNPAPLPEEYSVPSAVHVMMMNNKVQAAEIECVLEHVGNEQPAIIAGDFNSFSSMAASKLLKRAGFVDAHLSLDDNADAFFTWQSQNRYPKLEGRLDFIFHSPELRAVHFEVEDNRLSDHALIHAVVELVGSRE